MPVIVKYVVERNGKEVMTFASKKEADAHDRQLDIAEQLYEFLSSAGLDIPDKQMDELTFFMAQERDQLTRLLKGGRAGEGEAKKKPAGKPASEATATAPEAADEDGPDTKAAGRPGRGRPAKTTA